MLQSRYLLIRKALRSEHRFGVLAERGGRRVIARRRFGKSCRSFHQAHRATLGMVYVDDCARVLHLWVVENLAAGQHDYWQAAGDL